MFTAIDLFAGGGGLSVGLKQAGFRVVSAVEINPEAFATYKANHPEVMIYKQDIKTIKGKDLLKASPTGKIDLLAGCPPCQGFSSLTRKYKKFDQRNFLIREMGRLVSEIKPKIIMMENVPGLADKGSDLFQAFIKKIKRLGYIVNYDILQVADYGVPQSRRRLVLLAGLGFEITIPKATHSKNPSGRLVPWVSVSEAIKQLPAPIILDETHAEGGPKAYNWHVVRRLAPQNELRLKLVKAGKSRTEIPKKFRPDCHRKNNHGFSNSYGRMTWDSVSPTITGGCTTLSKGRFGHPSQNRTISVREAALLQTFPQDYIFDTPFMESACTIIGNALPCLFAKKLAQHCKKVAQKN